MRQKTIVGLIMAAGATLMVAVGGWVMALIVLVLISVSYTHLTLPTTERV